MTRCAESNQIRHLIVGLVFVVVMNAQAMGAVMSARTDAAFEAVPLAHLVFQPRSEFSTIGSYGCTIFPGGRLWSTEKYSRALTAAKDVISDDCGSSGDRLPAHIARVDRLKPWLRGNLTGVLLLVNPHARPRTEWVGIGAGLRGSSLEVPAALRAVQDLATPAALSLRAGVAATRIRPVLQQIRLNQKQFSAVRAGDLFELRFGLVRPTAGVVAELSSGPKFIERLIALSANWHSYIFPRCALTDQYQRT